MRLTNFDGTVASHFQLGTGDLKATMQITPEGALQFSVPLQIGSRSATEPYNPVRDGDLMTLGVTNEKLEALFRDVKQYVTQVLSNLDTGGEGGGESGGGGTIVVGNQMLPAFEVLALNDGDKASLGSLPPTSYIDHIAVEVAYPMSKGDGSRYEMAIGIEGDPEKFVPWFEVTNMDKSISFNIFKTLSTSTELKAFVRAWVNPNPYVPAVVNGHEHVLTEMRSDASNKVFELVVHSNDIADDDVLNTELFGEDARGKNLLDFGINIDVPKLHRFRIRQTNPALVNWSQDPTIDVEDGLYVKDKTYDPLPKDEEDFIYYFCLQPSTGDNDYVHIIVYDLDSETPDTGIFSFHVKNELTKVVTEPDPEPKTPGPETPAAPDPEPTPVQSITLDFGSAAEGSCGVTQAEDGSYTVALTGEIHSIVDRMQEMYPGLEGNCTYINIRVQNFSKNAARLMIFNPAYAAFYGNDDTVKYEDGVYYLDARFAPPDPTDFTLTIPIGDDASSDIQVMFLTEDDQNCELITIINDLVFLDETDTPVTPETENAIAIMSLDDATSKSAGDKGRLIIHVISF